MRRILTVLLFAAMATTSAEAGVRNFFAPEVDGARVAACLSAGVCGKPAADAFCKVQGYDRAMIFQRESFQSTRMIDSGQICTGDSCTAFKQVKCFSEKSDLAQL